MFNEYSTTMRNDLCGTFYPCVMPWHQNPLLVIKFVCKYLSTHWGQLIIWNNCKNVVLLQDIGCNFISRLSSLPEPNFIGYMWVHRYAKNIKMPVVIKCWHLREQFCADILEIMKCQPFGIKAPKLTVKSIAPRSHGHINSLRSSDAYMRR